MESPGEFAAIGCKEQRSIIKGKRTKRLRPQSPLPFTCGGGDEAETKAASSTEYVSSSVTEEEEDMANCLILLAQGHGQFSDHRNQSLKPDDFDEIGAIYHKFNSRRFMEAPAAPSGKAGYFVYECKTCNRTFPSFQALGGHRASHKKPKLEEKRQFSDEEEGNWPQFVKNSNFSLQLSNNRGGLKGNRGKVHECIICGAEFNSGQALGGHMRRHRGPIGEGSTSTALSLTNSAAVMETEQPKQRNVLSLNLDLNLPAPEEYENRESKLSFSTKQKSKPPQSQQPPPPLVFSSAPALVGCHY